MAPNDLALFLLYFSFLPAIRFTCGYRGNPVWEWGQTLAEKYSFLSNQPPGEELDSVLEPDKALRIKTRFGQHPENRHI
jgi:hypothetical protein